jgi:AGZA family xanthine/uracil permease-like MFS transporter
LAALLVRRVPAAMILSVVITTIIGIPLGVTQIPNAYDIGEITLSDTLFQLDISSLFSSEHSIVSVIVVIISFTMVDLLDTLGTLIGTANKGGLLDDEGNLPQMDRALLADATATTCGALLGTSSVTTYIESGAGVVAGGRTGLTAVAAGVLFLMAIFLAPIAGVVPVAATSPILVMVGILMMDGLKKIDLQNMEIAIPAIAMIVMMPFTYSIANGIAIGLILHVFISIVMGRWKNVNPVLILLVLLFSLQYVLI